MKNHRDPNIGPPVGTSPLPYTIRRCIQFGAQALHKNLGKHEWGINEGEIIEESIKGIMYMFTGVNELGKRKGSERS